MGSGADGCIDMLSQASLGAGDEVVCGWPSFPSYPIYAAKQGAVVRKIPLLENRYDLEALASAVTPQTKLVYVCHPNNPTGTMNTKDELDAFFDRVPRDVLVVVDQAYFEYIDRDGLSRCGRGVLQAAAGASSCSARSRRSTASRAFASGTPSAPRTSARRWRRYAGRSTSRLPRRSQHSQVSATMTRSRGAVS